MTDYRQFYRTGRFSEAVRYCENELRLDPENAQAAILLARALAAIDDIDGSLRVIDNFISTGKMNEKVLSVGRYLSFQFGDFQRSIGYSEALLRLHSDDEKSHHHKIHALLALGMEASARQFAEESVSQIEPALQKARKAFERIENARRTVPVLYEAWRLCPVRPVDLPGGTQIKSDAPPILIQYWSQGEVPADIKHICLRWDSVAEQLGLPAVERYDKTRAREWISQNAPAFLLPFDRSFHPAMESDIFRIAHATRAPTFYVDVDSWPMPATTRILRHCMENRGTLLYIRDYMPWIMNGLFVSYPDSPFIIELRAQALAVDTNYEKQSAKTIDRSFGPGRYNNVVHKLLSADKAGNAITVANSGTSQVSIDGHIIYFARESSVASVKPPYPLDYKTGDDNWKRS